MATVPWLSANSILSFEKETTVGTAAALSGTNYENVFGITNRDVNLPDRQITPIPLTSYGQGRRYAQIVNGVYAYSGSIPFQPLNGLALYPAFGTDTYDGVGQTHTLSTKDAWGLPTFSMLALLKTASDSITPPFQRVFPGCTISSLSLSAQSGQPLNAEMGFMSFKPLTNPGWDTITTTAATYTPPAFNPNVKTVKPYMWSNVTTASDVQIGSVTIGRLEEFSLRIDNRLTPKYYFGANQEPTEYIPSIPNFSFTGRIVPNSVVGSTDSLYNTLMTASTVQFNVKLSRSTNDYIQIQVLDALLTDAKHPFRGEGNEILASFTIQPRDVNLVIKDGITSNYNSGWV